MHEHSLIGLSLITAFGIFAQWFSWRLHLPSILILLIFGFLAGPITGFVNPDEVFGDLLFPLVSLSVAIILFEGGLSLKISKLKEIGNTVRNLVTICVAVTWVLITLSAYTILGFSVQLSALFGAILVVTGPTVVLPLLRYIKPKGKIGEIIRWEGIMNDPIGAILAVLVFEAIISGSSTGGTTLSIILGSLNALLIGLGISAIAAGILYIFIKKYWIPEYLHPLVSLALVVITFTLSNIFQPESGLLTVTLMGVFLANQKSVAIGSIVKFKENLTILLISALFIILSARLKISDLDYLNWQSAVFLLVLIFVVRPVAIFLSTIKHKISWQEKVFLSWLAPRGIVAAAVSSIFAIYLEQKGFEDAKQLVPLTFIVIIGTVSIYGLSALPIARWLKLALPNPQGILIAGAHDWICQIATPLKELGFRVLLIDTNSQNIENAKSQNLETHYGSILSDSIIDELELSGIGKLLSMTSNEEVNALAALHFREVFSNEEVYHLPGKAKNKKEGKQVPFSLRGRLLFGKNITFEYLSECFAKGAKVRAIKLTTDFDFEDYTNKFQNNFVPLFLVTEQKELEVVTTDIPFAPSPNQTLISLFLEGSDKTSELNSNQIWT